MSLKLKNRSTTLGVVKIGDNRCVPLTSLAKKYTIKSGVSDKRFDSKCLSNYLMFHKWFVEITDNDFEYWEGKDGFIYISIQSYRDVMALERVSEAHHRTGVSERSIRRWLDSWCVDYTRYDGIRFIHSKSLDEFIQVREEEKDLIYIDPSKCKIYVNGINPKYVYFDDIIVGEFDNMMFHRVMDSFTRVSSNLKFESELRMFPELAIRKIKTYGKLSDDVHVIINFKDETERNRCK